MKLNLGSGKSKYPGFVNVDSNLAVSPDFRCNLGVQALPFSDNSVTEVIAFHLLEHLGQEFFFFLQDLYRVCKHDAIIHIKVPHHRHDVFVGDPTHIRPITLEMMNRFSKTYNDTESTITETTKFAYMYNVNFEIPNHKYILEPYFETLFKTMSYEQANLIARTYNNVITEIHFDMKVIK